MLVLINGILLFSIAFFIHLFIWRIHLPKNHTRALLIIFFGFFVGGLSLFSSFHKFNLFEYVQFTLLFLSLTLAYITTYSGIEVESPSLRIVLEIARRRDGGLEKASLEQIFTNDILVGRRLEDLVQDKMITVEQDKYKLMPKGAFLVRLFVFYRKLLKAKKGG
jgi:hypothetical protein